MAEGTTVPDYPRGVTFEQVWATLQDVAKQQKETDKMIKENARQQEETARLMKETDQMIKETDQMMKENARLQRETARQMEETDRHMKKTDEQLGGLHNRFGEIAEHLVKPGINTRFNELGYHFDEIAEGNYKIQGEDGKIKAEIDLLLQNDDTVMAVEVKVTPKIKHIEEHINRIEILRDRRRKKNDQRQVEGAIAGAIFAAEVKKATIEAGLYVIEQSGDTMKIEVPEGFEPRRW